MRKIKLFISHDENIDEYESRKVLGEGISNWEEVSDEDFNFIYKYKCRLAVLLKQPVVLVEEYIDPIPGLITNIKDRIQKEIDAEERKKEKEREARLNKSKLSAAKKLERARAKISELEALVQKEESK